MLLLPFIIFSVVISLASFYDGNDIWFFDNYSEMWYRINDWYHGNIVMLVMLQYFLSLAACFTGEFLEYYVILIFCKNILLLSLILLVCPASTDYLSFKGTSVFFIRLFGFIKFTATLWTPLFMFVKRLPVKVYYNWSP